MNRLEAVVEGAAAATSLEELAAIAFRALGAALGACPAFFAEIAADGATPRVLAGEAGGSLRTYLEEHLAEDPLGAVVMTETAPVSYLGRHVDARAMRASRAYHEFFRVHDFEHHLLVRCRGPRALAPGALSMGFTRGRRARPFDDHDLAAARVAAAALRGAARRLERGAPSLDGRGLTPAEARVVALLPLGLTNAEIAARLGVSVPTVKTHLTRGFDKLGVRSRAQAVALLRG